MQLEGVGVLSNVPYAARRNIAAEACASLSNDANFSSTLTSREHVQWFIESVGAAFSLELADISVIYQATQIFSCWLSEPEKRPPGAGQFAEDAYVKSLLALISNLFTPRRVDSRAQTTGATQTHIDLCKQAIQAILGFFKQSHGKASEELSVFCMNLSMQIADSLVSLSTLPFCYLAEELADDLLSLTFYTFLSFENLDQQSWSNLESSFKRWCHRPQAIAHWQAATNAASAAVMRRLYNQNAELNFFFEGDQIQITDAAFLTVAWKHLVSFLPDPAALSPQVFTLAVQSLEKIVDVLLFPVEHTFSMPKPTDANSILRLFGDWLFKAISSGTNGEQDDAEGRAIAIGILCRLFSQPQSRSPIQPVYLEKFYAALHAACTAPDSSLFPIVMVIVGSEELFLSGLAGVRVLMGSLVYAIRQVIPSPELVLKQRLGQQVSVNLADLRRSCYKIMNSVFTNLNHFPMVGEDELVKQFEIKNDCLPIYHANGLRKILVEEAYPAPLWTVKAAILDCLFGSLYVETDANNLRYLLNSVTAIVTDTTPIEPALCSLFLEILSGFLIHNDLRFPVDVYPSLLMNIGQLARLSDFISAVDEVRPAKVVESLCILGDHLLSLASKECRALVPQVIEAVSSWACSYYSYPSDTNSQQRVLQFLADCASCAFVPVDGSAVFTDNLEALAQLAIEKIAQFGVQVNMNPAFPEKLSFGCSDVDYNYGVAGHCLLSFNDDHDGDCIRVNSTCPNGSSAFKIQYGYDLEKTSYVPEHYGNVQYTKPERLEYSRPDDIFLNAPKYTLPMDAIQSLQKSLDQTMEELADYMKNNNKVEPHYVAEPVVLPVRYERKTPFSARNLFLAQFAADSGLVKRIQPTKAQLQDSRPQLSASLLFIKSPHQTVPEILSCQPVSKDFASFCELLANQPELEFKDENFRLHVKCPSMMPRYGEQYMDKRSDAFGGLEGREAVAYSDCVYPERVCIIWSEASEEDTPIEYAQLAVNLNSQAIVYLIIQPLTGGASHGLYKARILVFNEDDQKTIVFGPLLDGMIIRRASLPGIVRDTVISAEKYLAGQTMFSACLGNEREIEEKIRVNTLKVNRVDKAFDLLAVPAA